MVIFTTLTEIFLSLLMFALLIALIYGVVVGAIYGFKFLRYILDDDEPFDI